MAEFRCEECGKLVDYDEEADRPVEHACVDSEQVDSGLDELDFDNDTGIDYLS